MVMWVLQIRLLHSNEIAQFMIKDYTTTDGELIPFLMVKYPLRLSKVTSETNPRNGKPQVAYHFWQEYEGELKDFVNTEWISSGLSGMRTHRNDLKSHIRKLTNY